MKTEYRIWRRSGPMSRYEPGDLHSDLDAAKAATGTPSDVPWDTNGEGNYWPTEPPHLVFVGAEEVPESLEDRIQLAVDLIVGYGGIDGDHHKAWVMDQVVRVLTGDRYEQVVAEACAEGGEWDEGIAP